MMSGNLFQFDEYHHQQQHQQNMAIDTTAVGDIKDYLTCDLKLSDTTFSDLFSEFDIATTDYQYYDGSTTANTPYLQHAPTELPPPPYDATLLPTPTNTLSQTSTLHTLQPVVDDYISSDTLKNLIEQHRAHQTIVKYSSSPPPPPSSVANTYTEPSSMLSMDMPEYQSNKGTPGRKPTTAKRSRPSPPVHLPKLIKKPEPIPVTLDQFQALIRSAPDTSTSNVGSFSSLLENSTIIGNNIPLKIVKQSSYMSNNNSSDEGSHHDSPTNHHTSTANGSFGSGTGGRVRRKSSHNAIEKRYRSSINERILELKEIVADTDEKVQKSGVLRRTIEYIRQMQSTNRRLEEENNTLKIILKRLNLTNVDVTSTSETSSPGRNPPVKHPTTPPSSHSESSESTLGSSDEAYSPVPKRQKRTTSKQGMVNGSRLVLCCFMLCVLITNPFNYLLNLIHASDVSDSADIQSIVGSRTLQAASNNENLHSSTFLSTSWRQLVAWMLNLVICLVCLVKLFVYGEPIVPESEMHEYYDYKKKADQLLAENQLNEARVYYRLCCEKLYVTIDSTLLYYLSSIIWQMTRFCVNLIFLGRWLTFWSGWTKSIDTRDYSRELSDCLLQLWKIEYHSSSSSSFSLFNLFLSTLNTSMDAGRKLDGKKHNEIYFLLALTLKRFDGIFVIFVPYVLKCFSITDIDDIWLADADRLSQFILEKKSINIKQTDFLPSIRLQYLEYLLFENIQNQLLSHDDAQVPQQPIIIKNERDLDLLSWWQHSLHVIRCISNDKQHIDDVTSSDVLRQSGDTNRTIYHMARSMNIADERFILIIETIHSILLVLNDDDDQTNATRIALLEQLGQSSRLIAPMIDNRIHDNNDNEDNLDLAIHAVLLDGILSLRLRLLTSLMAASDTRILYLHDFQQELDNYRLLNRVMKLPKQRLYLFESIFRVSSGLNPLTTQTLFERALKPQNPVKEELPNLDIIAALLLFCHFLPSTVYHYRNVLQQAATLSTTTTTTTSSKNNDLHRLRQQCSALIRQPYLTL